MELNVCQRGEPSHIHIRRPSRDQVEPLDAADEPPEAVTLREADDPRRLA
jgi:hypothetical protein